MHKEHPPVVQYTPIDYHWEYYRQGGGVYQESIGSPIRYQTGRNIIDYSTYPNHRGRRPWNTCSHYQEFGCNPVLGTQYWDAYWPDDRTGQRCLSYIIDPNITCPQIPSGSWNRNAALRILDQIDLNSKDNVLLYSGIVQAIPLLGSVLKLNSICRKIIRETSKSFRRKPFTSVIKSLISADFIDRFVISPTLDDAKRFQDACDYTLRVMQTLRDRNWHATALKGEHREVLSESTETKLVGIPGRNAAVYCQYKTTTERISKAFALMDVRYNMTAVAPLKVYAQRVGLTRPLDSVWDLVPFSFVADYFFRSGDFISTVSDKMSEVEGLKGKIARIHDLWGTFERRSQTVATINGYHTQPWIPSNASWVVKPQLRAQRAYARRSYFERFRVPDPMSYFNSLWQPDENWGSINFDLSLTKKRTLAELFIQAKLRP